MSSAFKTLTPVGRSDTLAQKVRVQLREAVMAGRFNPGEKLTIRDIARALDVSLTPAREALYNLASEGVLEMRSNGSVYVPELTEDRIVELTKIRVALECLASREAIQRISDSDVNRVAKLNESIIEADAGHAYSKLISLNWQFHFTIYRASALEQLVRIIEGLWTKTGFYLNIIYPRFGEVSDGINNHIQIVRALKMRDADRLASAINMDINFVADALLSAIRHAETLKKSA